MKKIPSIFVRDPETKELTLEPNPECLWVFDPDIRPFPTRKWDGTACKFEDGILWARYDAKHGKTPPPDFIPAQGPDANTGHWPGWVPANGPQYKWHQEALQISDVTNGVTYELCGPKINGNPERLDHHVLIRHGLERLIPFVVKREACLELLSIIPWEGIVFYRENSTDMAKIKRKDLGLPWPVSL